MATLPLHTGALPRGELLGRYRSYEDAQKVVDHLAADEGFNVKMLTIVGNDLRSVEQIRGRLSYPRVAGTGALQGALFGAFMGLLLMLFSPEAPLLNLGMAVLMGTAIWMIIGVVSFAARRGNRGFVSASQLTATTYDVVCDFQVAVRARQLVPGAGVTSLNAVNDPTGQSSGLASHQQGGSPQPPAAERTTPPPAESAQGQDRVQSPGAQAPSSPTEHPATQGASASADQDERARATQQWQQPGGKPRYGVRLEDVEQKGEDNPAEQSTERTPEQSTAQNEESSRP